MEEKLIEFVRKTPFLYDKKHSSYKNIYLRDKKFQELSILLDVPAAKLKKRWRTLKDSFYKHVKKLPSSGSAGSPKKSWKWMDHLMFLKDVEHTNKSTSGNFQTSSSSECSYGVEEFYLHDIDNGVLEPDEDIVEMDFNVPSTSTPIEKKTKKRKVDEMLEATKGDVDEAISLAKQVFSQPTIEKTPADHFFEGLAKQTKAANLSPIDFAILQNALLKCFNKLVYNIDT